MFSETYLNLGILFPLAVFIGQYLRVKRVINFLKRFDRYITYDQKKDGTLTVKEKINNSLIKYGYGIGLNFGNNVYNQLYEVHVFAPTRKVFYHLLKQRQFDEFFKPFSKWVQELYSHRNSFFKKILILMGSIYSSLLLFFYITETKEIQSDLFYIELLSSLIQLFGITFIYFFIIYPFVKTKKLRSLVTILSERTQSDFYSKRTYEYLFGVGIVIYLVTLYLTNTIPSPSVVLAFIHVLLLGFFSEKLIEKGSPFLGETLLEKTANKAILISQHGFLSAFSICVIYFHFLFASKYLFNVKQDLPSIYALGFISIILLFQFIMNWLQRIKLTKDFFNTYQNERDRG